jgi:exonuclease VII small subunit
MAKEPKKAPTPETPINESVESALAQYQRALEVDMKAQIELGDASNAQESAAAIFQQQDRAAIEATKNLKAAEMRLRQVLAESKK